MSVFARCKKQGTELTVFGIHHGDENGQQARDSIRRHQHAVCVVGIDSHRAFAHVNKTLRFKSG